ncbi:hypothetical protein F4803DRAFT_238362 [Xylaria telfairii]|nr:hypothetical protein F4803DRAFT_238362 [Xylaria telfairii]
MTEYLKSVSHKRNRAAKSCEPCRSRKIKCDRRLPCRPCMRSRASLLCTYKSNHPPVSPGSQATIPREHGNNTVGEGGALPSTPDTSWSGDLPGLVGPFGVISEAPEPTASGLSHRVRALEQLLQHPEHGSRQKGSLEDLEARLSKLEQRIGTSPSEQRPPGKSELRIKLPRPHLRPEHEKTRLFGKTHWVHSLDQFNILSQMQTKPYSVVDGVQAEANGAMLEAASARRRAKTHGAKLLHEPMPALRGSIPAKAICDQALDGYLRTFEPMFRILHVPSFMREYEGYWAQAELAPNEFLMKFTMVLTIGAVFLTDRSVANEIKRMARNWVYAVQWWLIGPTERDAMSIDGIQVFCLLLLARQTSALGGTASIITEALSKLSFTIGLHIDPYYHLMNPFESELRRRLWLTVLELTAITSLNSTLPLLLVVSDYRVALPSNIADSKLGKANTETAQDHRTTKHEELDCSLQLLLAKSLRLRTQVIHDLNDSSREGVYEKVIAQANSLQAHCRELATVLSPEEEGATREGDIPAVGSSFHHKFLDTYFRRLVLFLHRPFAHQARQDHRFLLSRKTCLESSLIMAAHTEAMDLQSGELVDDFSYCCISGGGMFKGAMGQDIIMGVSLEIVTQLEEEGLGDPRQAVQKAARGDPLARLLQGYRQPLVRYLRHVQEQWRQVIRLGRPSLKQYIFVSCILSHIEALEAGRDTKPAILDTIRTVLRACTVLLKESPAYGSTEIASEWVDDTSPDTVDTMALFGFDFNALDPTFAMDIPPVWTDMPSTAEAQNFI